MIRILIVDDHAIVRTGVRKLLETEADLEVVGEAADGKQAIELARRLKPDVMILDLAMPELGGLDCVGILAGSMPDTRIIIFSMFEKESFVQEALQAGAQAYVLKGGPSGDLIEAVRSVCRGGYYFSNKLHATMIDSYLHPREASAEAGFQELSGREKQVFRLMIFGKSTAEMGDLLCVSPKTIEKYRTAIHKKLGLRSTVDMVKYALQTGLVEVDELQL